MHFKHSREGSRRLRDGVKSHIIVVGGEKEYGDSELSDWGDYVCCGTPKFQLTS